MRDYTDWDKEDDWSERHDRQIPTLAVVLDPIRLRKNLRFLSLPPRQWGKLGEIRIQVLRCHKGRCTFEVALGTTTGVHMLIGKVSIWTPVVVPKATSNVQRPLWHRST